MSKQIFLVRHGLDRLIPYSEELAKRDDVIQIECDVHDSGPNKGQPIMPSTFKDLRHKKILENVEAQTSKAVEAASQPARPGKPDAEDEKLKSMSKVKLVDYAQEKYGLELDVEDSAEVLRARIKAEARSAAKKAPAAEPTEPAAPKLTAAQKKKAAAEAKKHAEG